ncbi:hypothetical protein L1987_43073 [Smallanthus sonchifolius]|uniref:Uncharacterized protein n=1 Tax=Smallanthus sonchifolius TaxID=185202 RepID=A0ACB9GKI9_9ASTR|nr:hypothetical protein L1987_43073 [Smallanthus sonchifolius]
MGAAWLWWLQWSCGAGNDVSGGYGKGGDRGCGTASVMRPTFVAVEDRMFYGPGGPYALFAGKDASRALAKMSFEEKDLNGDLTGLGVFELEALQDWEYKFMSKYVQVGSLIKPVPAPEPSTADQPAESTAADHVPSAGETKEETTSEANKRE